MCRTSENVQNEQGCAVQARMCHTNQTHHQHKRECAVQTSRSSSFGTGRRYSKILSNE